jgi:hypothetical protein
MAEDYTTARVVTLTDGVLSIAMTLLVLDVHLPGEIATLSDGELWQQLVGVWPHLFSYLLSFLVIAVLWITHVQKFRHLTRMTGLMVWLNILFLLGVSIVPFTTALIAENGNAVSTAVYACGMAFASLMLGLMSVHGGMLGLVEPGVPAANLRSVSILQFGTALIFAASAGLAFINPDWAKNLWFLLIPLNFLRGWRRRSRDSAAGAAGNGQAGNGQAGNGQAGNGQAGNGQAGNGQD